MKIGIISGTLNCVPLLQYLSTQGVNIKLFTGEVHAGNKDFFMVRQFCASNKIEITEDDNLYEWLRINEFNFVFVLGYSKMIDIQQIPFELQSKFFNIHFGDLPAYRGPTPIFWQLKNGEKKLALCIHQLNEKFDDGDVVWRKEIPYEPHFTYGLLEQIFSHLTIEGVVTTIKLSLQNLPMPDLRKKEDSSHYYKRPQLKDVSILWDSMSALEIVQLINACNPWNNGASSIYNGLEIKILDAELDESITHAEVAGTVLTTKDVLKIACVGNTVLKVNLLHINGLFVAARYAEKMGIRSKTNFKGIQHSS